MLCLNAPRKPMARLQVLITLILVLACAAISIMPLMKINIDEDTSHSIRNLINYIEEQDPSESAEEKNAAIDKIMASLDLENASVGISVLNLAKSVKPLTNATKLFTKMLKAKDDKEKVSKISAELKSIFITDENEIRPEVKDLVVIGASLAGPMIPDDPSTMNNDKIGEMIAAGLPSMIGFLFALILSVVIPLAYIILALATLISVLANLKDPVIGAAKLSKRMPKSVVHPLTLMLVSCLSSSLATTTFTLLLLILAGVGTLVNVLFTRLHAWEKKELAYANAVQAVSLFSIGAFVFYFINLLKMGVFKSFLSKLIPYFMNAKNPGLPVYTDIAMIVLAAFFALCSTKYLAKVLRRVSLSCNPKKKGGAHCTHLVRALFIFIVPIFPMMALGSTANNGRAFFSATVSQEYALFYGFIAVGLMALTELVLLILRKIFGKGLTKAQIADVMTNVSENVLTASAGEEAQEAAEESGDAPAEEAPTAEAQSEETSTEEAPSEAIPVGDTSAETIEIEDAPAAPEADEDANDAVKSEEPIAVKDDAADKE